MGVQALNLNKKSHLGYVKYAILTANCNCMSDWQVKSKNNNLTNNKQYRTSKYKFSTTKLKTRIHYLTIVVCILLAIVELNSGCQKFGLST